MKKRILSLLLVVVMIFALPLTAYAANEGETVTVSFSASHSGITGFDATLNYDHSALELVSITHHAGMGTNTGDHVVNMSADPYTDTTLFTATFKVLPGAKACVTYPVSASGVAYDADVAEISISFAGGSVAASADHSWGEWTGSAATCGAAAKRTRTCSACGATETDSTPATGNHTFGDCENVNDTQHKHVCSVCKVEELENHTWDAGTVTTQPTCSQPGVKTFKCTKCDATKTEEVKATGNHTYGDWKPVDGEDKHEGTCSCGATTKENHIWEWVTDKAATSTTTGIKHEECSECGAKRNENTEIPKVDAGLDDVPKTGDITSDLVMITMAVVVMFCAAGAYIFKRKTR